MSHFANKAWIGMGGKGIDVVGLVLKVFVNYFQIISAIGTFEISIPDYLKFETEFASNPVKQIGYSMDCYLV